MGARRPGVVGAVLQRIGAPARLQRGAFERVAGTILLQGVAASAERFVVDQAGVRRPDDAPAARAGAQTEIDVVEGDREGRFIEAAERGQGV